MVASASVVSLALTSVDVGETHATHARPEQFAAELDRAAALTPKAKQAVVPARTPLSGSQAAEAIGRAYTELVGEPPSEATLAILTSHWSLETAQGQRMYNFNFAGIKGTSPEGMTALMSTREGHGASAVRIRDGFRAYSTAESGALDYISLLQRRYGSAVEAARAEDPAEFAYRLKEDGYYTGNEHLYARGVTRLANRAMALGLDAVGGTSGALSSVPVPASHYFSPTFRAAAGELPRAPSGEFGASVWESDAMVEEITRAALRIAADYGARANGSE